MSTTTPETFVSPVREHREALGLTRAQLCAKAQVGLNTLYLIERGYTPKIHIRRSVAEALDADQAQLFPTLGGD